MTMTFCEHAGAIKTRYALLHNTIHAVGIFQSKYIIHTYIYIKMSEHHLYISELRHQGQKVTVKA